MSQVKKMTKWLQDNGIGVLDWTGNSPDPDLNLIENCWGKIKKIMSVKKTPNLDNLKT